MPALSGIGYHELACYLEGGMGLPEAVAATKYRTHSFARRQFNWFRLSDGRIHWLDINSDVLSPAIRLVTDGIGAKALLRSSQ